MENKIQHHGIKGQRWGVRRFQNSNGSLTPSGKKRYSVMNESEKKLDKDIKNSRKRDKALRRQLSESDIVNKISRLEKEKKLKDLIDNDINKGKNETVSILKTIGTSAITAAGTAVATYAIKAALQKKFDLKEAAAFIKPKK